MSTDATKGWTAAKPASTAAASAGSTSEPKPHNAPRARRPSAAWTARSVAVWKEETMTRAVQPASSIAAAVSAATASPGSHPGSWGAFLISTLTVMPSQTARTSANRGT